MALAILCSGQGRQHRDMFKLTGDVPEAVVLFKHATKLLGGRDPRDIVQVESNEVLHHNRIGQILCTLQALAAAAALKNDLPERRVVAGYSVGEVAAWGVAGLVNMADTLDLVAHRAETMDSVSPPGDGLLFIRGLAHEIVDELCRRHDAAIAIVEPGDAFIVGGSCAALRALAAEAKAIDATRIVEVAVEIASHTKRLGKASTAFRERLRHVRVTRAPIADSRLLSGIDGSPVLDFEAGLDKLAAQISQTVQWADCLDSCMEAGATAFLEFGPGRALSEMAMGAYPTVPARGVDDFKSLQGLRLWLARQGCARSAPRVRNAVPR